MPRSPVGKIDVAIAPSDSKRMYALIQTADQGSLWRSDDGGASLRVVSWDRSLIGRAGYYIRLAVNPQNADDVLDLEQQLSSIERRRQDVSRAAGGCGDCHDIWIDPKDPRPLRADRRRRRERSSRRRAARASGCRTGRCTTSPSTTACRTGSTATGRTTARCAGRARRRNRRATAGCRRRRGGRARRRPRPARRRGGAAAAAAVAAAAGAAAAAAGRPGSRTSAAANRASRFPIPTDANIVWSRRATATSSRAGTRGTGTARSVSPCDHHVRLGAEPVEVPLSLDGAARVRSVRSQHRLLRLPGRSSRRRTAARRWTEISPDLSTKDPKRIVSVRRHRRGQPRAVLRRARVRDRAVADAAGADLGRHQRRQGLVHARRAAATGPT